MKILVIGDSCKDVFIYGTANRLCPEAPVPVFIPKRKTETGGMAANVYENIESLNVEVDLITNSEPITKTRSSIRGD
jgi:D-beta-D-heptose 7-phosphate kinase/D-beta-D-heptose 1-phosphate adenosyltransferase